MKLITTSEAAELCGISRWQYEKYRDAGVAPQPTDKKGKYRSYLYDEEEVIKSISKIKAHKEKRESFNGMNQRAATRSAFDEVINTNINTAFNLFNKLIKVGK